MMASHRPFARLRYVVALAIVICFACCVVEPCDGDCDKEMVP